MTSNLFVENHGQSISNASSPEEAAKIFLETVGQNLGQVIKIALEKAVDDASNLTLSNDAVSGWQGLVKSAVINFDWEPISGGPVTRKLFTYTDRQDAYNNLTGAISVGISLQTTF